MTGLSRAQSIIRIPEEVALSSVAEHQDESDTAVDLAIVHAALDKKDPSSHPDGSTSPARSAATPAYVYRPKTQNGMSTGMLEDRPLMDTSVRSNPATVVDVKVNPDLARETRVDFTATADEAVDHREPPAGLLCCGLCRRSDNCCGEAQKVSYTFQSTNSKGS